MNQLYAPKALSLLAYLTASFMFACHADDSNFPSIAHFTQQRGQLLVLANRILQSTTTRRIPSPYEEKLTTLVLTTRSLIPAESTTITHRGVILHHRIAEALEKIVTNWRNKEMLELLAKDLNALKTMDDVLLTANIIKTFNQTNELIMSLHARLDTWGTSWFQRTTRNVNQLMQEYKIDVAAKRIAPYALLGLTFLYINEAGKVESINLPGIPTIKRMIGNHRKSEFIGLDTLQKTFNPAALLLTTIVMGDLKQAVTWSGNKFAATWSWLQGKSYCTSPLFQSKLRFTDLPGNSTAKEQLQTLARYTLIEKQAQLAGHPVTKGYLLVGDPATTQQYAHAFAAEVTALHRGKNSTKLCALYDVHASLLLTKSLDAIIKEVEEWSDSNQTVIVINELDWLFTCDKPDVKVTSDLINSLAKVAKPTSKKEIIVIATACPATAAKISPAVLTANGLGIKIVVQALTDQERSAIIKREAANKGLTCSDEFLAQYVAQLKEQQAPALVQLVDQAFSLAQANQEIMTEKHLTLSLQLQSK